MKRIFSIVVLILIGCCFSLSAQDMPEKKQKQKHRPHQSQPHFPEPRPTTYIKDKGEGAPVNFGLSIAPTFCWMHPNSEGYSTDGMLVGMRYGIPLNINLTHRKSFYVCTGVYVEQIGGKLCYRNGVSIPQVGVSENSEVHSAFRPMYFTVPLGVTLKTKSMDNFFVVGNIGVYNSLLLQAYTVDSYLLGNEMWTRSKTTYKDAATFKESLFGGLGVEYSLTQAMRVGLMVNYVHTLTNFFKGGNQAYNSVLNVNPVAKMGYIELELHVNFF